MVKNDIKKEQKAAARERGCAFCKNKTNPEWKKYEDLRDFLSVRGRIISRQYSGVCAHHQKELAKAVKQARHLALLPFTTNK